MSMCIDYVTWLRDFAINNMISYATLIKFFMIYVPFISPTPTS